MEKEFCHYLQSAEQAPAKSYCQDGNIAVFCDVSLQEDRFMSCNFKSGYRKIHLHPDFRRFFLLKWEGLSMHLPAVRVGKV